eukprot:5820006-Pyramimonas_sp.AAC.1
MSRPSEQEFTRQISGARAARRSGPTPTPAPHLTSTLTQGQTLRQGATINCARGEDAGRTD